MARNLYVSGVDAMNEHAKQGDDRNDKKHTEASWLWIAPFVGFLHFGM